MIAPQVASAAPLLGAKADFPTGATPTSATSADFDADGKPDLAVVNGASNTVSVLLGDGSGGFGTKTDFPTGSFPSSATATAASAQRPTSPPGQLRVR